SSRIIVRNWRRCIANSVAFRSAKGRPFAERKATPSRNAELPAFDVHRRVGGVPEALALAGALHQDQHFRFAAGQGTGRLLGERHSADAVLDAAARELARGRIQVAHARLVVAAPAQAARAIGRHPIAMTTKHDKPPLWIRNFIISPLSPEYRGEG